MAVNQTGAMYKSLTFDGEDSRDYGVYITGQAVFNAPEREVEMISIPGRNGQLALDRGRFENIEVTYPAGIFADTEAEFAEAVSNFRNLLCSKKGYVRLQDDYNPNEYRMAVYKSGLELDNVALKAGEFEIVFDCKPQRWLTDGETAVTVADGDTLTNPTQFNSEPLLEVEGYGTIGFNGYSIDIENAVMGTVTVVENESMRVPSMTLSEAFCESAVIPVTDYSNVGDSFTALINIEIGVSGPNSATIQRMNVTTQPESGYATISTISSSAQTRNWARFRIGNAVLTGTIGTDANSTVTSVAEIVYIASNTTRTSVLTLSVAMNYDASTNKVTATVTFSGTYGYATMRTVSERALNSFVIESTKSILGNPTYIDCELGEAYLINNGSLVSLNAYIDLGSDLPKLAPGENTFSIDSTITELKVIPRWWKV